MSLLHRAVLAAAVVLVACSSGADKPRPAPLEPLKATIPAQALWSERLGAVDAALRPELAGNAVVVAGSDGSVQALALDSGKLLWRGEAGERLSAGVGSDGRHAAVVTANNDLVVLDAGKLAWRARLDTRVVTPPLVAGERVFVLGMDRSVQAYDAIDGRKLWSQRRSGDPLTLLQPGVLLPYKDTLVAGQGARLAGFDPLRGTLRWEATVASPRGTNEVERLADLVGPAARAGQTLCARAFQAAVGCVDAERGQLAWSKTLGGSKGVAADAQAVYAADGSDRISAWKRTSGEPAWNSERLLLRGLSAPVAVDRGVVFGDAEGLLHVLDRADGKTLARLATDGKPLVGAPLVRGTTLVAVTRGGGVYAFRLE